MEQCIFSNNYAVRSAIFEVGDTSTVNDTGSTYTNNFASQIGVLKCGSDSYFNFTDSYFYKNHAEKYNSIG